MTKILIGSAVTTAVVGALMSTAAWSVTAAEVSAACGQCHGLSVNGVTVAAGPGLLGFTAYVSGRDQATWTNTIARMVSHGAAVSDPNGTAAFLAGLGIALPTPTLAPTATPTPAPVAPTGRPIAKHRAPPRHHPSHSRLQQPTRSGLYQPTLTPTTTPTATPTPIDTPATAGTGSVEYQTLCARCHEPSSPGFVGHTIYGTSLNEMTEAIGEVPQMQFLRPLLGMGTLQDIAAYLGGSNQGGDNTGSDD